MGPQPTVEEGRALGTGTAVGHVVVGMGIQELGTKCVCRECAEGNQEGKKANKSTRNASEGNNTNNGVWEGGGQRQATAVVGGSVGAGQAATARGGKASGMASNAWQGGRACATRQRLNQRAERGCGCGVWETCAPNRASKKPMHNRTWGQRGGG